MSNALANMFDFRKLGFLKEDNSAIGIDVGSSSVKVVQLKLKGGKAILETYGELALGTYGGQAVGQAVTLEVDKLTEAITDLFREANVTTRNAALSIPLRSSLLKVVDIPSFSEKKLNQIIPIEARKYIPVPITEVALDWWVIPDSEFHGPEDETSADTGGEVTSHKKEVLIVAIHKETINRYTELVSKLKLEANEFEVETFSSIRAVASHDITPMAILDLGASTSKLAIVDYGIIKVSHVIDKGGQDITHSISTSLGLTFDQAEKKKRLEGFDASGAGELVSSTVEYIFYEVGRVIADFERKYSRLVPKIILTGGGTLLKGIVPLAQKTFQAEIIPGHAFNKTESPAFLADILADAGPEFAVAIGLALRKLQETA
ncbi:MAG TPA: type IV pilus assembly protein PilM [Candidatus Paceibacterota bacterium]